LVGTTLYARDREKIVALDLGVPGKPAPPVPVAIERITGARVGSGVGSGRPGPPPALVPVTPPVSFAGSWKLDPTGSTTGLPFSGLHPAGAPSMIFVTQPANGALIVESAMNTGHTRYYRPGKSTTTEIASGTITMSTSWSEKRLVAEGSTKLSSGVVTQVKETISRDGEALIVEIAAGDKTSKLRYIRMTDVGPCASWPTPCKKAAG
jgi:hypothetical protein